MKDWSYKAGEKNGVTREYSIIEITLFNRLLTSKLYKDIAKQIDLDVFIKSEYQVTIGKRKSLKRYLNFIWFDLLGEQVEVRIELNKEIPQEFRVLHDSIVSKQRHSTNKIHSDPHYRPRFNPSSNLYTRI